MTNLPKTENFPISVNSSILKPSDHVAALWESFGNFSSSGKSAITSAIPVFNWSQVMKVIQDMKDVTAVYVKDKGLKNAIFVGYQEGEKKANEGTQIPAGGARLKSAIVDSIHVQVEECLKKMCIKLET